MKAFILTLSTFFAQFAIAGQEGGGTYALCNKTIVSYHTEMSKLKGKNGKGQAYQKYSEMVSAIEKVLPRFALKLREVENYSWFYLSPKNGCQFRERNDAAQQSPLQLRFHVDEPIHMVPATKQVFVRADRGMFEDLEDPEHALLNEAVRGICAAIYMPSVDDVDSIKQDKRMKQNACVLDATIILARASKQILDNKNVTGEDVVSALEQSATAQSIVKNRYYVGHSPAVYMAHQDYVRQQLPLIDQLMSEFDQLSNEYSIYASQHAAQCNPPFENIVYLSVDLTKPDLVVAQGTNAHKQIRCNVEIRTQVHYTLEKIDFNSNIILRNFRFGGLGSIGNLRLLTIPEEVKNPQFREIVERTTQLSVDELAKKYY